MAMSKYFCKNFKKNNFFSNDDSHYFGDLVLGKVDGRGRMTFAHHPYFDWYEGDWKDGVFHGTGYL